MLNGQLTSLVHLDGILPVNIATVITVPPVGTVSAFSR